MLWKCKRPRDSFLPTCQSFDSRVWGMRVLPASLRSECYSDRWMTGLCSLSWNALSAPHQGPLHLAGMWSLPGSLAYSWKAAQSPKKKPENKCSCSSCSSLMGFSLGFLLNFPRAACSPSQPCLLNRGVLVILLGVLFSNLLFSFSARAVEGERQLTFHSRILCFIYLDTFSVL